MNIVPNPVFPAKLLLFGEYNIVIGGQGLTIPYTPLGGSFAFARTNVLNISEQIRQSNNTLREFAQFLITLETEGTLLCRLNLQQMQSDVQQGLFFDSNIPHGYGLGSSGALCAAVYHRYANNALGSADTMSESAVLELRSIFAQLEAFFHGTSSGIDPLVSYLQKPLHILGDNQMQIVTLPKAMPSNCHLFLYNTGKPRKPDMGLVPLFVEKQKDPEFAEICRLYLKKYNSRCIQAFLQADAAVLLETARRLSQFQLVHFEPMIPHAIKPLWKRGINNRHYYLKLCGAGGGGFMLGVARNTQDVVAKLGATHVQEVSF